MLEICPTKELGSNNPLVREGAEHAILMESGDGYGNGANGRQRVDTRVFTQVRDPREEVKPLLFVCCIAYVPREGPMEDEI